MKNQEPKVKIMEWPTKESADKSWGTAGFDRHFVAKK